MDKLLHDQTYAALLASVNKALGEGIHPSLEIITALMHELGEPHSRFSTIQITGTNGKSSTTYLTADLLASAGFSVGRFTSPELIRSNERIAFNCSKTERSNGQECASRALSARLSDISDEDLHSALAEVLAASEHISERLASPLNPSEFELITAAALVHFERAAVDFAVLEVGLGGKWDSTSVTSPSVSVITGIGLDHREFLGDTLEEIAADKAHIIKPGSAPILGDGFDVQLPIFLKRAKLCETHPRLVREKSLGRYHDEELNTFYEIISEEFFEKPLTFAEGKKSLVRSRFEIETPHARYENLEIYAPAYQVRNAALALSAAEAALGRALKPEQVQSSFKNFFIPARFECIDQNPLTLFDGSHNPQAVEFLAELIKKSGQKYLIAFGAFKDKEVEQMLQILAPHAQAWVAIQPDAERHSARLLPADECAKLIQKVSDKPLLASQQKFNLSELQDIAGKQQLTLLISGSLSMYHLLKSNNVNLNF